MLRLGHIKASNIIQYFDMHLILLVNPSEIHTDVITCCPLDLRRCYFPRYKCKLFVSLLASSIKSCILYFQIDVRIQDEDLRARKFFHHVSFSRVLRECEARLVEDYIPYLLARRMSANDQR